MNSDFYFWNMILSALLVSLTVTFCYCEEKVKYAAVIFRHGDRTPTTPYPKDPWRNESLWPVKFGELTNLGKKQHYALGQWLRTRYSNLVSEQFDPSEVYVRSTDVDRTLMSAMSNLAGLYPPKGKSIWDENLLWQPIPVHTVKKKDDEVLAMEKHCAVYDAEKLRYKSSKAYKERLSKYQGLMDYLTTNSGLKVKDYDEMIDIYSTLYIETLYNFTLPNWTNSIYPDKLREPACYSFTTVTGTPTLARLKIGPLLDQIMSHMIKVVVQDQTEEPLKLSIYSGHDITVGNVLNGLGMFDGLCPAYTSTVIMELLGDTATGSHFIQILYRNSVEIVEPIRLSIPYCGVKCPLEKFRKLYKNILNVNWEQECTQKSETYELYSLIAGLYILGVCLFAGYIIKSVWWFNKRNLGQPGGYLSVNAAVKSLPVEEHFQNY